MRASTLIIASLGLLWGCGSTPPPPTAKAAPASMAAPPPPNPCAANPCDATTIDPSINPCAGEAASRGAEEAPDAPAAPGSEP